MASYSRKYSKKKFNRRRKRRYRRSRSMVPKSLSYNVHYFKRSVNLYTLSYTSQNFGGALQLSDLNNYTEFTALYDYYQILGAKFVFIPQQTENLQSSVSVDLPYLYHVTDRDGNGPTTESGFLERGCTPVLLNRVQKFYLRSPKVKAYVDDATTATAGMQTKYKNWLDCAATGIDHFGKYFLVVGTRSSGWQCQVMVTYYMKFKGHR